MNPIYPTLGALAVLVVFGFLVGRQNRDLLRARAYRDFLWRLTPILSTAVFVGGLPFIMRETNVYNASLVLAVYLTGAAVLTVLITRGVAPEERRAGRAFRNGDYDAAVKSYEALISTHSLPRYHSALAASLDAAGEDPQIALESAEKAIKEDPKLGIAYYNRASALAAAGDKARARGDLQTVFRVDSSRTLRRAAAEALESLEKS